MFRSLGTHEERGKNAQALAHLAQALRLNPENREASDFTAAMLTQLTWHVPLAGSMRHDAGVYSAQFSPDGQRVVTASGDKTRAAVGCRQRQTHWRAYEA